MSLPVNPAGQLPASTRLSSAVFPLRRACLSLEWKGRFAYTEDGGEAGIQGRYFFGGARMPHPVKLGRLASIGRKLKPGEDYQEIMDFSGPHRYGFR